MYWFQHILQLLIHLSSCLGQDQDTAKSPFGLRAKLLLTASTCPFQPPKR